MAIITFGEEGVAEGYTEVLLMEKQVMEGKEVVVAVMAHKFPKQLV
jgi:hypothetical protein